MAKVALPSLPLSQQLLAWVLRALGYADDATTQLGVSVGTLKSARRGNIIPRSWGDLVDHGLSALGAAPDEHRRSKLRAQLRRWDEQVSALPSAPNLSLDERVHVLLVRALPEVGVRLGAVAAWAALRTGTAIDEWLWLVEPFDARFFGRVVHALFQHRRPDLGTNEERKDALEKNGGERGRTVDWRTVERWYGGDIDVPNSAHLAPLARMFGDGAETMLRVARLACVLRENLREWIGNESATEWTSALADVGRVAARTLSDPTGVAMLLRWLQADLDGPRGDDVLEVLQPMLPGDARSLSRQELCARLAVAASEFEGGATVDRPIARWVVGVTRVIPHLRLSAHVCGDTLAMLPAMDLFRPIEADWMFRSLMKAIAAGDALPITYADGSPVERPISDRAREIARRWRTGSLRFRQAADESSNDVEVIAMLLEVLGIDTLSGLEEIANGARDPLLGFIEMLIDPARVTAIPDEFVAKSRSPCLARARALAERGDASGALDWVNRAPRPVAPMTSSEMDDLLATLSAIAHGELDRHRVMRQHLRTFPGDADSAALGAMLLDCARFVEGIVTTIMQIGQAPEASHAQLAMLVAATPVAMRLAYLRDELSGVEGGFGWPLVEALVSGLRAGLDRNPTHGRGCAVVMLWAARCGEKRMASDMEKRATHYGAADFLEREVVRIETDLGLTEDAG